jgi:hypothetical protein
MYENKCIICWDKCSYKPCKCNAYIHEECLIKWNDSVYNNNLNSCPHCKNIINNNNNNNNNNNINIKIIITKFINEINLFCYELSYVIMINIKVFYVVILKLLNILYNILSIILVIISPIIIGILLYSINYILDMKKISYIKYIEQNLLTEWVMGVFIIYIVLNLYDNCKYNDCLE